MSDNTNGRAVALPGDFITKMMSGIAQVRATTIIPGGKPFFRLNRGGRFVFGQNSEEMQDGSSWAVNLLSMQHGWSCWVDYGEKQPNALEGETMVSMTLPLPEEPPPIRDTAYKVQYSFDMKCMDGEDKGTEVQYKINSKGGTRATIELLAHIYAQLDTRPEYPNPVIQLTSDSYPSKKWGQIWFPIFTVVGWADVNGNLDGGSAPLLPDAAEVKAAPVRKRKEPLGVVPQAAPAPVQPAPTAQTHVGQRRRPAAS